VRPRDPLLSGRIVPASKSPVYRLARHNGKKTVAKISATREGTEKNILLHSRNCSSIEIKVFSIYATKNGESRLRMNA
jgi:hypothetical protein